MRAGWTVSRGLHALPSSDCEGIFTQASSTAARREETVETICGHGVVFTKMAESGPHAWRSRIFGEMACKQCPAKSFKVLYGADEVDARAAVIRWLGGGEEESHAGEVRSVCSDCV